jgi:hypothetical protein
MNKVAVQDSPLPASEFFCCGKDRGLGCDLYGEKYCFHCRQPFCGDHIVGHECKPKRMENLGMVP